MAKIGDVADRLTLFEVRGLVENLCINLFTDRGRPLGVVALGLQLNFGMTNHHYVHIKHSHSNRPPSPAQHPSSTKNGLDSYGNLI